MKARKERLTVTVDPALVKAANEVVAAGRASSFSGWVSLALEERAAKEQRLQAMAQALEAYEAQFGEITPAELAAQARADSRAAVVVRGLPQGRKRRRPSCAARAALVPPAPSSPT